MSIPPWIVTGLEELASGVEEIPGRDHNARILEYHQTTGLGASDDETPWCASFVNWCLDQVGVAGTGSARARSFESWGREAPEWIPFGAIVVLWRGSPDARTGHVGFLLDRDASGLMILGGNQGNRVCIDRYPATRLVGLRWPA